MGTGWVVLALLSVIFLSPIPVSVLPVSGKQERGVCEQAAGSVELLRAGGLRFQVLQSLVQKAAICFALRPLAFGFRVDRFRSWARPHVHGANLSVLANHAVQVKTMTAALPDHLALPSLAYAAIFAAVDGFTVFAYSRIPCGTRT